MDDNDGSNPPQGQPHGMFDSLRQLLGTLAGVAQTRIELLGIEVEEQVARLTAMLLWAIVSLFLAFTTVVLIAVAILGILDDQYFPQSSSTSVDGLSQSFSMDVSKFRETVDAKIETIRSSLQGIRLVFL